MLFLIILGYHCSCIPHIALDILTWLGYCNSMLNPIIYAFTVEEFKASVKSLGGAILATFRKRLLCNETDNINEILLIQKVASRKTSATLPLQVINGNCIDEKHLHIHNSKGFKNANSQANAEAPLQLHEGKRQSRTKTKTSLCHNDKLHTVIVKEENNFVWSAKPYALLISPKETGL